MKRKLIKYATVLAVLSAGFYLNMPKQVSSDCLSEIQLANIDALSNNEESGDIVEQTCDRNCAKKQDNMCFLTAVSGAYTIVCHDMTPLMYANL